MGIHPNIIIDRRLFGAMGEPVYDERGGNINKTSRTLPKL
jgi:hypothetical protein